MTMLKVDWIIIVGTSLSVPFLFLGPQFPPPPPLLFINTFFQQIWCFSQLCSSQEAKNSGFRTHLGWFPKVCIPAMTFPLASNELWKKRFCLLWAPVPWVDYKPRSAFYFKFCTVSVEKKYKWQARTYIILKMFHILIHQGNGRQNYTEITSHSSAATLDTSLEVS